MHYIQIDGYGIFHNAQVQLLPELTVLYGVNGAGKSTFLSFLQSSLFGFAPRNSLKRYEPFQGGVHGGRITFEANDTYYVLERTASVRSAGELRIHHKESGDELSQEFLRTLLGGVSRSIYERIFAFGLYELQQLELVKNRELASHLYSVGLGSNTSLGGVDKLLTAKMEEIYKQRGRKPLLNQAFESMDGLRNQLREIHGRSQSYRDIQSEIAQIDQELRVNREELALITDELTRIRTLVDAWPHYQEFIAVQTKLKASAHKQLPVQGYERIMDLQTKIVQLKARMHTCKEKYPINDQQIAVTLDLDGLDPTLPETDAKINVHSIERDVVLERLNEAMSEYKRVNDEIQVVENQLNQLIPPGLRKIEFSERRQRFKQLTDCQEMLAGLEKSTSIPTISMLALWGWVGVGLLFFTTGQTIGFGLSVTLLFGLVCWWITNHRSRQNLQKQYRAEFTRLCSFFLLVEPAVEIGIWKDKLNTEADYRKELQLLERERERRRLAVQTYETELKSKQLVLNTLIDAWERLLNQVGLPKDFSLNQIYQLVELQEQIKEITAELEKLRQERNLIYVACDTENIQEISRLYQEHEQRRKLVDQSERLQAILSTYIGGEIADFQQELAGMGREGLLTKQTQWEQRETCTQQEIDRKLGCLGQLQEKLSQLEVDERQEEVNSALAAKCTLAQGLAEEWAVYAACKHVIQRVQKRYEKERQPKVLLKASQYFQQITDGLYQRVYSPLEMMELRVEDKNGRILNVTQLSQGTVEQLYLSLRLALVNNYAVQGVKLPVVFDDILVNFDAYRRKNTIDLLKYIAKNQQIIMLTCHESITQLFSDNQVYRLSV